MRKQDGYHHGDLPTALVTAALEIIDESGVTALTLRAAARLAGVSHAAPAHHFGDKRGLLAAVAEEGFRLQVEHMQRCVEEAPDHALPRFRAVGSAYITFATAHPARFRVMFHAELADKSNYPGLDEVAAASLSMLHDGIVECQHAGFVRPGDPWPIALLAWSSVHGLASLAINGQLGEEGYPTDAADLAELLTMEMFHGLRA